LMRRWRPFLRNLGMAPEKDEVSARKTKQD
jgi:hypothetical protein